MDRTKSKAQTIERKETDDGAFLRTSTIESSTNGSNQITQTSQIVSGCPPIKQNNYFPKLQFNDIGQTDSSYFINSNANVSSYKSNLLMFSKRCPSPEEKSTRLLYDQQVNAQMAEQSIRKYTRRKSCKGGKIFGKVSQHNQQREKQFPLAIINMHIKNIIIEATKKKREKEKSQLKQNKKNLFPSIPKQPSFKNATGKSLFNSQQGQSPTPSPYLLQNNAPNFNSLINISNTFNLGGQNQSITQSMQKSAGNYNQKTMEGNQIQDNKKLSFVQQQNSAGNFTTLIGEKNYQQKIDAQYQQQQQQKQQQQQQQLQQLQQQQQSQQFNKANTLQINQIPKVSNQNNRIEENADESNDVLEQEEGKEESKVAHHTSILSHNLQVISISRVHFDEGNEVLSNSKSDLKSINSIKMEIEDRRKIEFLENEMEDQNTDRHQKDRNVPAIPMSLTKCKHSDRDSNSSISISEDEEDADENYGVDFDRKSIHLATKLFKDKKNGLQKVDNQRKSTLVKVEIANNDQESHKFAHSLTHSSRQINATPIIFHRNIPRYSVINVVAPPMSLDRRRQTYMIHKDLVGQNSLTSLGHDNTSKGDNSLQTKQSIMVQNIKSIQENQDLQDIVSEYLDPGSTDNVKYSPKNPATRLGNMKKVFKTATNMIALQNRVKANNSFYRNYYNLLGKVSVDDGIQYLSQMAEEILSTPLNRKGTVFCAPKKRKVFIHNTQEDKVKMMTTLSTQRLNQSVQKYVGEKQAHSQNDGFSHLSKYATNSSQGFNPQQFYQSDYFINSSQMSKFSHFEKQQHENKTISHPDYIQTNKNASARRLHDLNEYQFKRSQKKEKGDSYGNNELINLFKQSSVNKQYSQSSKNLLIKQKNNNSFQDKGSNTSSYFNINSNKVPVSPYLLPSTPKSTSHSQSRVIKEIHLSPQLSATTATKKQTTKHRGLSNQLNYNPIFQNINSHQNYKSVKNSVKNSFHS